MHDRTFTLEIYGIDHELGLALTARAAQECVTVQEFVHKILRDELLPDLPIPEQCAEEHYDVDRGESGRIIQGAAGRQTAEEFIRGGRTLEEIDDALYGPQRRAAGKPDRLVDSSGDYEINPASVPLWPPATALDGE